MRDYSATLTKVFDKTRNTHNESPETKHSIKLIETIRTNSMVVTRYQYGRHSQVDAERRGEKPDGDQVKHKQSLISL